MSRSRVDDLVKTGTPWEFHSVGLRDVWVKREDLCCTDGPRFSKIRGLVDHLSSLPKGTPVACLDTVHSHGGWGTAYVCEAMGLEAHVYYPGPEPREGQVKARDRYGATLHAMKPGRSAILWYRMRKHFNEMTRGEGHLLPNGLQLPESRAATTKEALEHTPPELRTGAWIVSVSTGTLAGGLWDALRGFDDPLLVCHMGYSRSHDRLRDTVIGEKFRDLLPLWLTHKLRFVDEGYSYKDKAQDASAPFPCNEYYDLKAWKWLNENAEHLPEPIIFWNIGE